MKTLALLLMATASWSGFAVAAGAVNCTDRDGTFLCDADNKCIDRDKKCDGTDDCSDGQDEMGCASVFKCEGSKLFKCKFSFGNGANAMQCN
jgi:hypothetical protein